MVDLNKQTVNKKYDTFEVLGLTFNLLNKNMWQVLKYITITATALFVLVISVGVVVVSLGILESGMFNAYNGASEIIESMFTLGAIGISMIIMLLFIGCCYTITWFMIRGIVGIDTGIESIESKKVHVPLGSSFIKLFAIQIIVGIISFVLSMLSNLSSYFMIVAFLFYIQICIASYLLSTCAAFSYFEIVAKGKSISNSISNAVTNLFFSKSGIMLNTILGDLIIFIITFIVVFGLAFFGIFTVLFLGYAGVYILASIAAIIFSLIFIAIMGYLSFFSATYSYLLYMLNEVRDDKVDSIK